MTIIIHLGIIRLFLRYTFAAVYRTIFTMSQPRSFDLENYRCYTVCSSIVASTASNYRDFSEFFFFYFYLSFTSKNISFYLPFCF